MTHKENDQMLSAVQVLVQHLCTKCPERAEYRNIVAKVRECFKWDEFIAKVFLWFDSNILYHSLWVQGSVFSACKTKINSSLKPL